MRVRLGDRERRDERIAPAKHCEDGQQESTATQAWGVRQKKMVGGREGGREIGRSRAGGNLLPIA